MNQLSANPFLLDDPIPTPLRTGKVKIRHIEWVQYTDAAHVVELQDQLGNIIWAAQGQSGLPTISNAETIGWVNGLLLPVLTSQGITNLASGKLLIYIE